MAADHQKPDPRELLELALTIIKADLDHLASKKVRTPPEMGRLSQYLRDLHAIVKVDEAESLKIHRDLQRLSPEELAQRLRQEAEEAPPELAQAIRDATAALKGGK